MTFKAANQTLEELLANLNKVTDEPVVLPVRVIYYIIQNKLALERALLAYHIARDRIIETYSNGTGKISEKEMPDQFEKASMELSVIAKEETEVEIKGISLSEIGEKEMPFRLASAIGFMLTEE